MSLWWTNTDPRDQDSTQERSGESLTIARIRHTDKPLAETKPMQFDSISEGCRAPQSKAGFSLKEVCTICTRPPKHNPLQIYQGSHTWRGKYTDSVLRIFGGNVHTMHLQAEIQCSATEKSQKHVGKWKGEMPENCLFSRTDHTCTVVGQLQLVRDGWNGTGNSCSIVQHS